MALLTSTIIAILTAISAGFSIDQLSGNRFSNLFFKTYGERKFKSNYEYEMD